MADIAYRDDLTYRNDSILYSGPRRLSWGAIWAGVFTFWAIWIVFEILAFAIFGSRANAPGTVVGRGAGIAIWTIILTVIAMYVAGRETGHAAAVTNRHDGLMHGMIMFGLAVVSVLVLSSLFGAVLSGGTGFQGTSPRGIGIFTGFGWAGFIALLLGWLAAMGGGSQGVDRRNEPPTTRDVRERDVRDIRPAA